MNLHFLTGIFLSLCILLSSEIIKGQGASDPSHPTALFNILMDKDSALFNSFNTCNLHHNATFFTEDIEFYHDKGGLTLSRNTLVKQLESMCNSLVRTRRELSTGSLKVYPINNYGAIQIGEHGFYQKEEGQPERYVSIAKFVHLWKQKGEEWQIARVLSFDHKDPSLKGEPINNELFDEVKDLDTRFFQTYNSCNLDSLRSFVIEDIEFYHDKGGITTSQTGLIEALKQNICSLEKGKIRRELIGGTLQVFPLNNYGAIEIGEHYFYITEKGKEEQLTGVAKFILVWQKKDENWKLTRVFSFDHQPTSKESTQRINSKTQNKKENN